MMEELLRVAQTSRGLRCLRMIRIADIPKNGMSARPGGEALPGIVTRIGAELHAKLRN